MGMMAMVVPAKPAGLRVGRRYRASCTGKLFKPVPAESPEKPEARTLKRKSQNFIPAAGIERIATAFKAWQEEEKFAKVVTREQVAKEDYNISPSRYIHVADAETHRPIAEILEELEALDAEAAEANAALRRVLQIGRAHV